MGHHHHKHALTTTSFTHTKTCRGLKQPLPAITYTLTYAAFKPALTFLKARPMFVAIPQETNPVKKSIHTLRSQHPFTRTPQITHPHPHTHSQTLSYTLTFILIQSKVIIHNEK